MGARNFSSWVVSFGLHILLFAAFVFLWRTPVELKSEPAISVSIVADTSSDEGASSEVAQSQKSQAQSAAPANAPMPSQAIAPSPPPTEAAPTPAPEAAPMPAPTPQPTLLEKLHLPPLMPKPAPAPAPSPAPVAKPNPQPSTIAPKPTPIQKAAPPPSKPAPAPQKGNLDFQFDVPAASSAASGVNSGAKSSPRLTAGNINAAGSGSGKAGRLQASLENILREQIKRCWVEPADLSDPQSLLVELEIDLTESGGLVKAPRLRTPASTSGASSSLLVAVDNARRATRQCAPYNLPADRYKEWQHFTFRFDPQKLRH